MLATKQYETQLDAKHRITLRSAAAERYRVVHRRDGSIVLKPLHTVGRSASDTPAVRKERFNKVIAASKAAGEKVPKSVKLVSFRELTATEHTYGKSLGSLAQKRLARSRKVA